MTGALQGYDFPKSLSRLQHPATSQQGFACSVLSVSTYSSALPRQATAEAQAHSPHSLSAVAQQKAHMLG